MLGLHNWPLQKLRLQHGVRLRGMFEMKHTKETFSNQRRIKHELCKRQVGDDVTVGVWISAQLVFILLAQRIITWVPVCCGVSHPLTDVTGFVLHLTARLTVLHWIHTLCGRVAPGSQHKDRVGVLCRWMLLCWELLCVCECLKKVFYILN